MWYLYGRRLRHISLLRLIMSCCCLRLEAFPGSEINSHARGRVSLYEMVYTNIEADCYKKLLREINNKLFFGLGLYLCNQYIF